MQKSKKKNNILSKDNNFLLKNKCTHSAVCLSFVVKIELINLKKTSFLLKTNYTLCKLWLNK